MKEITSNVLRIISGSESDIKEFMDDLAVESGSGECYENIFGHIRWDMVIGDDHVFFYSKWDIDERLAFNIFKDYNVEVSIVTTSNAGDEVNYRDSFGRFICIDIDDLEDPGVDFVTAYDELSDLMELRIKELNITTKVREKKMEDNNELNKNNEQEPDRNPTIDTSAKEEYDSMNIYNISIVYGDDSKVEEFMDVLNVMKHIQTKALADRCGKVFGDAIFSGYSASADALIYAKDIVSYELIIKVLKEYEVGISIIEENPDKGVFAYYDAYGNSTALSSNEIMRADNAGEMDYDMLNSMLDINIKAVLNNNNNK